MKTNNIRLCFLILSVTISQFSHAERYKRSMNINKVQELGLEIWTEYEPEWAAEVVWQGKKPLYIVKSPPQVSPPAVMSYVSFPKLTVASGELKEVATIAIQKAAKNYQVTAKKRNTIQLKPASYNQLNGYEAEFSGTGQGEAVDVKVFVGQQEGKSPVAMQVYTLKGKLSHISEQIRRAWQHVSYLENRDNNQSGSPEQKR